jgi:hypothetical protein
MRVPNISGPQALGDPFTNLPCGCGGLGHIDDLQESITGHLWWAGLPVPSCQVPGCGSLRSEWAPKTAGRRRHIVGRRRLTSRFEGEPNLLASPRLRLVALWKIWGRKTTKMPRAPLPGRHVCAVNGANSRGLVSANTRLWLRLIVVGQPRAP